MAKYYIASCVFTAKFPELSFRIQDYIQKRFGFTVVRCCVPKYKLKDFEDKMPEGQIRSDWANLPDSGTFSDGDEVYSLCHNCNNLINEMHPGTKFTPCGNSSMATILFGCRISGDVRPMSKTVGAVETERKNRMRYAVC